MQIVAIDRVTGDSTHLAKELATVMGVIPYEARSRVNAASDGPAVIASFAANELATKCLVDLDDAGFNPISIDSTDLENDQNRILVKQLKFDADCLHLWDQGEKQLKVNYSDIELLLRGAGIVCNVQCETTTKKKFAVGRALATGGLMMRKKVTSTTSKVASERQPFCHIYTKDLPAVVLRQDVLDYAALGSDCKHTTAENFNWICTELRRLSTVAKWDERIQTRPGLAQLLGPVFDPECDLDLAISLLVKSYLG